MTWLVLQNAVGALQLIEAGTPIPDGWIQVAETANPEYLSPVEPVAIQLSKGEWMDRFTAAELETIYTMAKTVVSVEVWLERFKVSDYVNPADPKTIAGVQALEVAGILASGRASEILG